MKPEDYFFARCANPELGYQVVGEFTNVTNDRFVVYTMDLLDGLFVTGDPLGWESTWQVTDDASLVYKQFSLQPQETAQMSDVIAKYHDSRTTAKGDQAGVVSGQRDDEVPVPVNSEDHSGTA